MQRRHLLELSRPLSPPARQMLELGRSQTDFALQAIVECRAAKAKRVAVLLRWHADGGEVPRGMYVYRLTR